MCRAVLATVDASAVPLRVKLTSTGAAQVGMDAELLSGLVAYNVCSSSMARCSWCQRLRFCMHVMILARDTRFRIKCIVYWVFHIFQYTKFDYDSAASRAISYWVLSYLLWFIAIAYFKRREDACNSRSFRSRIPRSSTPCHA